MHKKKKLVRLSILVSCFILFSAVCFGSVYLYYQKFQLKTVDIEYNAIDVQNEVEDVVEKPEYITAALLGTDASGLRTDSMMVIVFNKKTNALDLFGIPRDTYIDLSDQLIENISSDIWIPSYMKLTELYYYMNKAKIESPESVTIKAIEQLMGINIDHTLLVETSNFRKVVDSLGGVEIYVPRALHYEDPYQNLYIHLEKGQQVLTGKQAEQFVRFRQNNSHQGYGDFGRMEMQQYFLKSFLQTLVKPENINRTNDIITAMSEFISTDASLLDCLSYVQYLDDVDLELIQSHRLPGDAATINGGWYYKLKSDSDLHLFVQESLDQSNLDVKDSKDLKLVVKNGTGRKGIAVKTTERLETEGYTVSEIGNYNSEKTQKTRIIVREMGEGLDLLKLFNLAEIEVKPDKLMPETDIMIIVGGADA